MRGRTTALAALLLFAALTVLMTWPQARLLATHVPDADDPLLSIWRIAWIAHILPISPLDLMNGNIFHPEPRTLAYTDSAIYMLNRNSLGDRESHDIQTYSATVWNYLATPHENVVHGGWSGPLGQNERRLFPGFVAIAIAGWGLWVFERRRLTLVVVGVVGFIISLGLNTPIYSALGSVLFIYNGLRAPARASILVYLAVAGLVAYGWSRLEGAMKGRAPVATAVVAAALLLEYSTVQSNWFIAGPTPEVYPWLAAQPRSVVLELPVTTADRLDLVPDGIYMFRSTQHWQPLLNGYSGFFPKSYIELTERMKTFPGDDAVAYLKQRGVDLVVIHGGLMSPDRFGDVTAKLLLRSDFSAVAQFQERRGPDMVFRLLR